MTSIKYDYSFLAGFFIEEELHFNSYNLNLHLYINTESEFDQQIAFKRMDFLIHDIVENAVFVDEADTEVIERLTAAHIRTLTVGEPGPIDQIVHVTLVEKLTAITEDKLKIFESDLSSVRGGGVRYMYYRTDDTVEDYEMISNDSRKWWNDNYPRVTPIGETSDIHNLKHSVTWKDLDLHWEDADDTNDTIKFTNKKQTNIIKMKVPEK